MSIARRADMDHDHSTPVPLAPGLSRDFLHHHRVCPRRFETDGALAVAVAPQALTGHSLDELALAYDREVRVEAVSQSELDVLIERAAARGEQGATIVLEREASGDLVSDARELAAQPPVIRFVNLLIREAYEVGASDIHLESTGDGLTSRMRVDGVLIPAGAPTIELHHAVVSRLKLLADLDIAERRRPQDGRIRVRLEHRELDLRVSTVPTLFGESVVLRLLERGGRPVTLQQLGMPGDVEGAVAQLARRPHGLVVVTGPTGSGKTTTLYAALACRNADVEKIITVEDPIEYQLTGITQVPVNAQAGVTFGSALRSLLRQDPDVIMIGEMRDAETVEIGVQAAMTGHLVLTTLHTNDAVSAIARLLDLGVPDYLIAGTLDVVLAQRLVRRVCPNCTTEYPLLDRDIQRFGGMRGSPASAARGVGCADCRGTGYRGRVGVFELLTVTEEFRDAVAARSARQELRRIAAEAGMRTLREDAWDKIRLGITSPEEVRRVLEV